MKRSYFIASFIIKFHNILNYTFLAFYIFNIVLFYFSIFAITLVSLAKSLDLQFIINMPQLLFSIIFDTIQCADHTEHDKELTPPSASTNQEPSTLKELNKQRVDTAKIPAKFESTVKTLVLYDSEKALNKTFINKYKYVHSIIGGP